MKESDGLNESELEKRDKQELIEIIQMLQDQVQSLKEVVASQAVEMQELKDQIGKNSRNSGKPPSSDGMKKPRTRNLRRKQGRSSGGQKGHQGHTLELVDEPDQIELYPIWECGQCAADLATLPALAHERRQVFDIPAVEIEVTEHRAEIKICPLCQIRVKAPFPEGVTQPVQYGRRIKAQATYLNTYQLIPLARTCELLGDFYNHSPAQALILDANAATTVQIEPSLQAIQQHLIRADLVHFDESGLRVEGHLNWLHVASTSKLTYYIAHPKRGQEGMKAMGILPALQGRAMHDHWRSYFTFDHCQHALCNAHHLRELQFITDQYHQPWAQQMSQLLLDIKAEVAQTSDTLSAVPAQRQVYFAQRYDALIQQGLQANPPPKQSQPNKRGRKKQSPPKNLLDRLQKFKPQVLAFMSDFRVPFDNNQAERDVRMIKIKQKISGSFRTRKGADTFCAIRSYISTVRKHNLNVIQAIYDALASRPFIPPSS